MHYGGNFDEKDKNYYLETFKTEATGKLRFYKTAIQNHEKNIRKLEAEIGEQRHAIAEDEAEIATIEAKLNDPDGSAKRLLFRDFKSVISNLLNGEEAQQNCRFGLKIQKQGPFIIEKPFTVSSEGKKHTETRTVSVIKFRNNEKALEKFRDYLRQAGNMPIDGLTFDELKTAIGKFFNDAPKPDIYGEEYEMETFVSDSVKLGDNLFRI